jgi:hypothetical protein
MLSLITLAKVIQQISTTFQTLIFQLGTALSGWCIFGLRNLKQPTVTHRFTDQWQINLNKAESGNECPLHCYSVQILL